MICGREDLVAVTVYDWEMVAQRGYDYNLLAGFADLDISYIVKSTNVNTISHYVSEKNVQADRFEPAIKRRYPTAQVTSDKVANVSPLGSNMRAPHFLKDAAKALCDANVQFLGTSHSLNGVDIQFVVVRQNFAAAQLALHAAIVETNLTAPRIDCNSAYAFGHID